MGILTSARAGGVVQGNNTCLDTGQRAMGYMYSTPAAIKQYTYQITIPTRKHASYLR